METEGLLRFTFSIIIIKTKILQEYRYHRQKQVDKCFPLDTMRPVEFREPKVTRDGIFYYLTDKNLYILQIIYLYYKDIKGR